MVVDLDRIPWDAEGLPLVFDYEASGLHPDDGARPSCLGLRWSDEESVLIPVDQGMLDKPGTTPTLFGDAPNVTADEWVEVHDWMSRQLLIGHGAKIDLWFAWAGLRGAEEATRVDLSESLYWDTLICEALLNPNQRVTLELVARRSGWNEPYEQADLQMRKWLTKNKLGGVVRYDLAPWELIGPYLQADIDRTWKLWNQQMDQLEEGMLGWGLLAEETALCITLFRMEQRGLPYRVDESMKWAEQGDKEVEALRRALPFEPSTKADVIRWLESYNVRLPLTENGNKTVNKQVTDRAREMRIPWIEEYQRWAQVSGAVSLWYRGWAEKANDGRVRANYRQVKTWDDGGRSNGTVSGRLAVNRVNVQAIPNKWQIPEGYGEMHGLIAPEQGYLWEIDLSQAEMRTVASMAKCRAMLDGFIAGADVHDNTTELVFEIDRSSILWDEYRAVSKRLGFGVIYGAGIRTLQDQIRIYTGLDMEEEHVRDLWDRYRGVYPELFRFGRHLQNQATRLGFVVLANGKRRVFHPAESKHKAMNQVIQGGVAAGLNRALIETEAGGYRLVGTVHDSLLIESGDRKEADEVAELTVQVFENMFPGCPFKADVKRFDLK